MTTFQEFEDVLRRLPPAVAAILRELLRNPLAPQASARLLALVRLLINGLGGDWELVRRALILLARLGGLAPRTILPVIGTIEAELAAAGTAGAAEGAGAAAAGGAAATALAVLAAALAVAFAFWSIGSEVMTQIVLPQDGAPCALDTEDGVAMATVVRTLSASAVGRRSALQAAIDAAATACAQDAARCGGGECGEGARCRPVPAIQSVDLRWRLFWTTAVVEFTCPCGCLPEQGTRARGTEARAAR